MRQHSMLVIPVMLGIKPSVITGMGSTSVDLVEAATERLKDGSDVVKRTAKRLLLELKKKYEDFLPSILRKMTPELRAAANEILGFPELDLDSESEPKSEEEESESEEGKNEGDSFGAAEPEQDEFIVKEEEAEVVLQSNQRQVTRESMDLEEVQEDIEQLNMQGVSSQPMKMGESFAAPQEEQVESDNGEEEEEESEAESEEEETESLKEPVSAGLELPTQQTFNDQVVTEFTEKAPVHLSKTKSVDVKILQEKRCSSAFEQDELEQMAHVMSEVKTPQHSHQRSENIFSTSPQRERVNKLPNFGGSDLPQFGNEKPVEKPAFDKPKIMTPVVEPNREAIEVETEFPVGTNQLIWSIIDEETAQFLNNKDDWKNRTLSIEKVEQKVGNAISEKSEEFEEYVTDVCKKMLKMSQDINFKISLTSI